MFAKNILCFLFIGQVLIASSKDTKTAAEASKPIDKPTVLKPNPHPHYKLASLIAADSNCSAQLKYKTSTIVRALSNNRFAALRGKFLQTWHVVGANAKKEKEYDTQLDPNSAPKARNMVPLHDGTIIYGDFYDQNPGQSEVSGQCTLTVWDPQTNKTKKSPEQTISFAARNCGLAKGKSCFRRLW